MSASLPRDLWGHVFTFSDTPRDACAFRSTCRLLRAAADAFERHLWPVLAARAPEAAEFAATCYADAAPPPLSMLTFLAVASRCPDPTRSDAYFALFWMVIRVAGAADKASERGLVARAVGDFGTGRGDPRFLFAMVAIRKSRAACVSAREAGCVASLGRLTLAHVLPDCAKMVADAVWLMARPECCVEFDGAARPEPPPWAYGIADQPSAALCRVLDDGGARVLIDAWRADPRAADKLVSTLRHGIRHPAAAAAVAAEFPGMLRAGQIDAEVALMACDALEILAHAGHIAFDAAEEALAAYEFGPEHGDTVTHIHELLAKARLLPSGYWARPSAEP
jgi:hypothetical protein